MTAAPSAHPTPTKPCIVCGKRLSSVSEDWEYMQPHAGGEVQFIFSYGSERFDLQVEPTVFRGVICDDCAAKYMGQMEQTWKIIRCYKPH